MKRGIMMFAIITATCNIANKNWTINVPIIEHGYNELHINFVSENEVTQFDNLKFGYRLTLNGNEISSEDFPHIGRKLESSDNSVLARPAIIVLADKVYTLDIWARNKGEIMETSTQFETIKQDQPHPSWIWNGEMWVPPVAKPNDGRYYNWNENSKSWTQVEDDVMPRDGNPAKYYG